MHPLFQESYQERRFNRLKGQLELEEKGHLAIRGKRPTTIAELDAINAARRQVLRELPN